MEQYFQVEIVKIIDINNCIKQNFDLNLIMKYLDNRNQEKVFDADAVVFSHRFSGCIFRYW
jgi:hypothetical protein